MELVSILLWFPGVVGLAAWSQYHIIEIEGRYPNKALWFYVRVLTGGVFLMWYMLLGFMWYWAGLFLVFSFWLPFNTTLNLLRDKHWAYLSPKNSFVDRMLFKLFGDFTYPVYVMISGIGFLSFVGIMLIYGKCSWADINDYTVNCGGWFKFK